MRIFKIYNVLVVALFIFLSFAISVQGINAEILAGNLIGGAEPKGFENIPWGANISYVKDLQPIEHKQGEAGVKIYFLSSIEWDGFEFDEINYYFFKEKLFMVILYTEDKSNWKDIEKKIFNKYGDGKKGKYSYKWIVNTTELSLGKSYDRSNLIISFTSMNDNHLPSHGS